MSDKEREICEGEIVDVYFSGRSALFDVEFVRGPRGDGDCFVVRRADGKVVYIRNFETIATRE